MRWPRMAKFSDRCWFPLPRGDRQTTTEKEKEAGHQIHEAKGEQNGLGREQKSNHGKSILGIHVRVAKFFPKEFAPRGWGSKIVNAALCLIALPDVTGGRGPHYRDPGNQPVSVLAKICCPLAAPI